MRLLKLVAAGFDAGRGPNPSIRLQDRWFESIRTVFVAVPLDPKPPSLIESSDRNYTRISLFSKQGHFLGQCLPVGFEANCVLTRFVDRLVERDSRPPIDRLFSFEHHRPGFILDPNIEYRVAARLVLEFERLDHQSRRPIL